ncbi:ROK family protein [Pigmentiphaga aceris]|uniref:ROK family protein n=1 Tax=Pigmentiphaga aceris TaxID=1940612 RepID=UPI001FE3BCC6|nr:ROK family protein [Pigmentiphaga aceris]
MKPGILAIDIGGTALKVAVIDDHGQLISERMRTPTPRPCQPEQMLDELAALAKSLPAYDRIAVGFPGVIRNARVQTAVNIGGAEWLDYPLADKIAARFGHPVRLVNDADMQGFALISGQGLEFVLTLGTGLGSALFLDGELMPHMELGHHPFYGDATYEECLGAEALKRIGVAQWNQHLERALHCVKVLLNADHIYLGGGNAKRVTLTLPKNVRIGSNDAGLAGGAALWNGPAATRSTDDSPSNR